jgi:nitrate reductase gamma subunit
VALSVWENDWDRIYIGLVGDVVLGGLQFLAVARYAHTITWSSPNGWVYLLFLVAIVAVGLYGLYARRLAKVQLSMPEQEPSRAAPSA